MQKGVCELTGLACGGIPGACGMQQEVVCWDAGTATTAVRELSIVESALRSSEGTVMRISTASSHVCTCRFHCRLCEDNRLLSRASD